MSLAFVPPQQRGKAAPNQATIQKVGFGFGSCLSLTRLGRERPFI